MSRRGLFCLASLFAALLLCGSRPAGATGVKARCISAYEDGQWLQQAQSLKLAAEEFALCAGEACPAAMHDECSKRLAAVRAAIPTIAAHVTDQTGAELAGVRLSIDSAEAKPYAGEALPFDPGDYQLTFEVDGYGAETRHVSVGDSETANLDVVLVSACGSGEAAVNGSRPGGTPAACRERTPSQVAQQCGSEHAKVNAKPAPSHGVRRVLLLGSAGLAAVGASSLAYFGLSARRGEHRLGGCAPNCSAAAVGDVRRDYLLANTALAVGAAGLVGAAVVWFTGEPSPPKGWARAWNLQLGMMSTVSAVF